MKWLEKFFGTKKTIEEVEVWVKEQEEATERSKEEAIKTMENELPELIRTGQEATDALVKAELRNPNVPEKAKNYITGNREHFLKLTRRFLDGIDFYTTHEDFKQYAQGIARPGAILSEFFGEEVKNVRKAVAVIEFKLNNLKNFEIKKKEFSKIRETIDDIRAVEQEIQTKKENESDLQQKLDELRNKQEFLTKEKEEFKTKPKYLKVKEDLVQAAQERQVAEQAITDIFSPLTVPLKKLAHKLKNEKLAKYGEHPLQALIQDYSFNILRHVHELRTALEIGELDLKPERRDKALESLQYLTKDKLGELVHRYANAKKRESDMQNDVVERPALVEFEKYNKDLKEIQRQIEEFEKELDSITIPSDEEFKEQLKEALVEYKIKLI